MAKAKTTTTTKKAATTRATSAKRQVQKRADQAPEAKTTTKAQSDAAEKLFKDADQAALTGLPPDMTNEQRENQVRKSALGY